MKYKEEKNGYDDLPHPKGNKYMKDKDHRKKKDCECPDHHHHHPNEKKCDCHKHDDHHCHHGFEKPYHDGHCDCGHHHQHDCDHHRNCDCGRDHDHHHHCGCGHHHRHHHGCHHHHDHCRRLLCDDDFRLRLGGLQNNMNFKLRQLIGCLVDLELEDGRKMEAQICYVGTNFVEIKNFDDILDPEPHPDPHPHVEAESPNLDQEVDAALEDESSDPKRHCSSWIIPVDKIKYVKVHHEDKCC